MKNCYIIIYEIDNAKQLDEFVDIINSNFISKKAKQNSYIVIVEDLAAKEVHDIIFNKLSFEAQIMVIKMTNFYGTFINQSVFDWLKEQFPNWSWVEK